MLASRSRALFSLTAKQQKCLLAHSIAFSRHFTSTTVNYRGNPTKYRNKRNNVPINKRIQTPEELLMQASNVDIDNLRNEVKERTDLRYIKPNKKWITEVFPDINLPLKFTFNDDSSNREFLKHHLIKKFGKINESFHWKDLQYSELTVGDVVDLSGNFEKSDLAVVIELPNTIDDPRYTLVNSYGELQFVSRSKMGLRIPNVFPKDWFKNCVYDEEIFWEDLNEDDEIIPIGKPKYKLEDVIDRNKIFESAVARSISNENAAKTFILPSILSGLISEILTEIINQAWQLLPNMNIKLEFLHNILQSNESPIQLTLYQIYNAVELIDLQMLFKEFKDQKPENYEKSNKKLFNLISKELSIGNQYDSITLGKPLQGKANMDLNVNFNNFYAFILSLRKNNQLYSHDSFSKTSSYVLILPLNRNVKFHKMVQDFKADTQLYTQLAEYISSKLPNNNTNNNITATKNITSKIQHILPYYKTFIELLKLYCAGSVQNSVLESFVIKIMRNLPNYKDLDITNSIVYDLLSNTGEIQNTEGPVKWWDNSMIPFSGVSVKCDYEQSYYDSITADNLEHYINLNNDIEKNNRLEFDDIIYCIDSENPLEIDDGVAIKKINENEFIISTFVADPSSYLNINNLTSQIAFERGLTLYLPDLSGTNAIPLLPVEFGKKIQLGYSNNKTRVLKISFKYNTKDSKVIPLEDRETISFGLANKFVKIDYKSVNKILTNLQSDESNRLINTKCDDSLGINIDNIKDDLKNLSLISQSLNTKAVDGGRVSLFDEVNVKKEIENITETDNKQIQLTFKDLYNDDTVQDAFETGARSEQLVSEIMVMANSIAGEFFKKNNIPAIYKIQVPLEKSEIVSEFANKITHKKNSSFKEITLYQEYLTKSTISPFPAKHEFLNIENYATVTSPLRRFWDLINHWQLHSYINEGKPMFSQENINYLSLHLKYKDEINNKVSNKVTAFYTFKALKYLQEAQKDKSKNKFKAIITKKPSESGLIEVIMMDYGVRCILETSWYALSDNKTNVDESKAKTKNLEIGDIIDDAIIKDIDLMEGSILLTSESL